MKGTIDCVRYDFICDRQGSFPAGHNDRQVFKFQYCIIIQKTGTNCEWPARNTDCQTRCPAMAKYLFQALQYDQTTALWKDQIVSGKIIAMKIAMKLFLPQFPNPRFTSTVWSDSSRYLKDWMNTHSPYLPLHSPQQSDGYPNLINCVVAIYNSKQTNSSGQGINSLDTPRRISPLYTPSSTCSC